MIDAHRGTPADLQVLAKTFQLRFIKQTDRHPHLLSVISLKKVDVQLIYNYYFPNFRSRPRSPGKDRRRAEAGRVAGASSGVGEPRRVATECICMGSEHKEQLWGAGAPRAQSYKEALAAQLIELGRPSPATRAPPASALPPVPAAAGARRVPRDRLKERGTAA